VALLDADDLWMPTYLEQLVALLEADPEIDLISPNAIYFGQTELEGQLFQDRVPPCQGVTFEKLLTRECAIFGGATFKRELVLAVGGFDEALETCMDLDLWLRMAQHGARFASTPEALVRYRRRDGSLSTNLLRTVRDMILIYEKALAGPELTPTVRDLVDARLTEKRAELSRELAKQMIVAHDFEAAAQQLALANAYFRSPKLRLIVLALRVAPELVARIVARRL
jgi:hypothetical protein